MAIRHLAYVACDRCGGNITEPTPDGADEARAIARRSGFVRVAGNTAAENQDVCRDCRRPEDRVIRA
jgi:hypothetical protein